MGVMTPKPIIAIVGATGLIGSDIIALLEERKVSSSEIRLFASADSAGEFYRIGGIEATVEVLEDEVPSKIDLAIFALSPELARKFAPKFTKNGIIVIDTSTAFRADEQIPLVTAGVNSVPREAKIIACPNPAAVQLAPVLKLLDGIAGIKRLVISTYHPVSSAGKTALDELWAQTRAVFNQTQMPNEAFQNQIAFNCIPQTDVFHDSGYTREELAIGGELRRILKPAEFSASVTTVRIPVFHGLSMTVNAELKSDLNPLDFSAELRQLSGIAVSEEATEFPMPLDVAGSDEVHVGRIRHDASVVHGLDFWVVADCVRRGSALNAVQIAEQLIRSE